MIKQISKELSQLIFYLNSKEKDKVFKALKISEIAHSNQLRKSGDPFIIHPLEVAKLLTSIKLDADSIAAGLLHDTLEDTNLNIVEIENKFGKKAKIKIIEQKKSFLQRKLSSSLIETDDIINTIEEKAMWARYGL